MLGHKVAQALIGDAALDVRVASRWPLPCGFGLEGATVERVGDLSAGPGALESVLTGVAPDVIVNCVGAIKQRDLASAMGATLYLNGTLPHVLALLNPNPRGRVIHVSTDCVFTGARGSYREAQRPDAVDLYGRSKAMGEMDYGRHLTLRTSIIGFELTGHLGLLGWFLRHPRGSRLRGFTKAIYSGLPTVTLARVIRRIILRHPDLNGLYHVASTPIDKYSLLMKLNAALDLDHTLDPDDSLRIDRSLDDSRFRLATGTARPEWDELVDELARDFRAWPYDAVYERMRAGAAAL